MYVADAKEANASRQLVRKTSSVRKGNGPAFNRTSKVFPNPQVLEQPDRVDTALDSVSVRRW